MVHFALIYSYNCFVELLQKHHFLHPRSHTPWLRHQMETFSTLLAICAGKSPVSGEFPTQRSVTRSFAIFFDLRLNKQLTKQSWSWWFETLSCPLRRQCNAYAETMEVDSKPGHDVTYVWYFSHTSTPFPESFRDLLWCSMHIIGEFGWQDRRPPIIRAWMNNCSHYLCVMHMKLIIPKPYGCNQDMGEWLHPTLWTWMSGYIPLFGHGWVVISHSLDMDEWLYPTLWTWMSGYIPLFGHGWVVISHSLDMGEWLYPTLLCGCNFLYTPRERSAWHSTFDVNNGVAPSTRLSRHVGSKFSFPVTTL